MRTLKDMPLDQHLRLTSAMADPAAAAAQLLPADDGEMSPAERRWMVIVLLVAGLGILFIVGAVIEFPALAPALRGVVAGIGRAVRSIL